MPKLTEAQKADRRQEILAAALRSFSRNGFHNTTVSNIVRESGLSQGAFYLYFQTKDDVIAALADDRSHSDILVSAIAAAEADPAAGLAVLFDLHGRTLSDAQRADERRVAIQGWAEALRNDAIRDRLVASTSRLEAEIARLIEHGQATGQFKTEAEPRGVARALIALFRGLTLQATWEGGFDETLTARSIEDMVRGALTPAPGTPRP